ncbi:hypothetical protein ACLI09_11755 [Flavobacterium sp. RHBU_24]|uniref:hypothetical protein n=1 Tax=Flavobacterium sp. RHBU_24 TaxID=3391185 RepID=UPI0039853173
MKRILRKTEILLHSVIIALVLWKGILLFREGMYFPAGLVTGLSLTAMAITIYWKKLRLAPREARQASYYIEGLAFLTLYVLCTTHERNLAQLLMMASIVFPFIGFATSLKTSKKKVVRG